MLTSEVALGIGGVMAISNITVMVILTIGSALPETAKASGANVSVNQT